MLDYNKQFFYSGSTDSNNSASSQGAEIFQPTVSYESVKYMRTLIPTIMSLVIVAVAAILAIVILIVVRFRIVTSISENMTNYGALKAVGYVNAQLVASIVLQFAVIAAAAALTGVLASGLIMPTIITMLESQSAIVWQPGIDLNLAAIATATIIALVALCSYLVARQINKLHPLIALRFGTETHNFKKNSAPLNKTPGSLTFVLALKQILQNKRQAVIIVFIVASVSFAATAAMSIYYNIGIENDYFVRLIAGEKPDAGFLLRDSDDTSAVLRRLQARPDVRKAFEYQSASLLAADYDVIAFVTRDFSQLEGTLLYSGRYPEHANEVALGGVMSETTGIKIGDRITVQYGDTEKQFLVVGLIQFMENNGISMVMTYDGIRTLNSDFAFYQLYVYLTEGTDTSQFIDQVKRNEGDIFTNTVDMAELIDAQFSQFGAIFGALAWAVLAITTIVIALVLYMVIKTMILNRSRDFGIQKALGFTTSQLMVQVALNYTPIVLVGVTLGCLAGFYGFNPLFTMLVHSAGIMSANMPPALLHTIGTGLGLTAFAFAMSMLMSWRIRTISPYEMVTN